MTEILIVAAVALVVILLLVPSLRRNRTVAAQTRRSSITATLTRIEHAKMVYVIDKQLKTGDLVTIEILLKQGYLAKSDISCNGPEVRFIVGAVGTPVTYDFASHHATTK